MTRAKAQEAIDCAFADGLKRLFGVLVSNLTTEEPDAVGKFHAGVARHDEAHAMASGEIERIFPE